MQMYSEDVMLKIGVHKEPLTDIVEPDSLMTMV